MCTEGLNEMAHGKPEVYIIIAEERRHVPDPPTLKVIQQINSQAGHTRQIETITLDKLEQ